MSCVLTCRTVTAEATGTQNLVCTLVGLYCFPWLECKNAHQGGLGKLREYRGNSMVWNWCLELSYWVCFCLSSCEMYTPAYNRTLNCKLRLEGWCSVKIQTRLTPLGKKTRVGTILATAVLLRSQLDLSCAHTSSLLLCGYILVKHAFMLRA